MASADTLRRDTKDLLVNVLEAFKTANPTMLARVHRARPESFPDLPAAYIDMTSGDVLHDSGTRTYTVSGLSFVLVDRLADSDESMLARDIAVDALLAWLAQYPQLGGTNGVWSRITFADEDAPFGDYDFMGTRFTFPDISMQDGRP